MCWHSLCNFLNNTTSFSFLFILLFLSPSIILKIVVNFSSFPCSVFSLFQSPLAGVKSWHQKAEIWQDQWKENVNSYRGLFTASLVFLCIAYIMLSVIIIFVRDNMCGVSMQPISLIRILYLVRIWYFVYVDGLSLLVLKALSYNYCRCCANHIHLSSYRTFTIADH